MGWLSLIGFLCGMLVYWVFRFDRDWYARQRRNRDLAARADQQTEWLAAGDPRGIYGEYMPPALFLEPERCALAVEPSNDGTPLLTRAAAMVKRAEYIEKQWSGHSSVRRAIDTEVSVEMLAIQNFLDHCSRREGMTYQQFVDYVRSSRSYAAAGDGSRSLTALDRRQMARVS